jgi:DNA repair photolyase
VSGQRSPGGPADSRPRKGRGALSNPAGRFETLDSEAVDDGWPGDDSEASAEPESVVLTDAARGVISSNQSPDVPFEQSVNPYRGCEHGCVYCYARPTHAWLGLSPGLDFETRLFYKPDAPARLAEELARPGYRCRTIVLGANTDPYQPIERRLGITRGLLEVLAAHRHPVSVVTKGALIERDLDLLAGLAADGLASVMVSVTTLDDELKRSLEPRTAAPARRLAVVRRLADAGVPVGVLVAPVIPALNDHELEDILAAAAGAGAESAAWILLRLPHEVRALFEEWLREHLPDRAERVLSLLRQARGGRDNDPRFGHRMRGSGPWIDLLERRFALACRRLGLRVGERRDLATDLFRPPGRVDQLDLL